MAFARPRKTDSEDELYQYAVGALGRRMRSVAELKRLLRPREMPSSYFRCRAGTRKGDRLGPRLTVLPAQGQHGYPSFEATTVSFGRRP